MRLKRYLTLLFLLMPPVAFAQVFDVPSADSTPTRSLLIPVENPKATVLLFIGGSGMLRLSASGSTSHGHTFVRSKEYWKKYGINAVLVDSPNDLGNAVRGHQRNSDDHIERVMSVAQFYQRKMNHPIWIFGHSMGTSTVSAIANKKPNLKDVIAGLIVAGTHRGETIPETQMLPVMAIHHIKEGCAATPVRASEEIIKSRPKILRSELFLIDGGSDEGHACLSKAYHGFNGTEDKLIEAAARFILAN